jgi:competence protein ComEC
MFADMTRSLGHRAPLLWIVVPFAAGLALAKATGLQNVAWPLAGALAAALAATGCRQPGPTRWAVLLVASMIFAGAASYAMHRARLPVWDTLPAREARLSVKVDRIFVQADPKRATGLGHITRASGHLGDLVGQKIYFSLSLRKGEAAPLRSMVLETVGVLVTLPTNPPGDSFDSHLAGAGINFRLTRGRVIAIERPAHAYYRFCAAAGQRFHTILGEGIVAKRPALAGLLRAMMLGATHDLSEEQHTLFMQSGTMHLFAISGLNIGVIAGALQTLLLLMRLPSWGRFVIGATLLWLFVDITGASPSAVRAFAMAVFLQAAFAIRRPANVLAGLLLSAFGVLLVAPLQLFSASFLMSYTIVAALLVLGLPLGEAWSAAWSPCRDLPKPVWCWWHHSLDFVWRSGTTAIAVGLATTLVSLLTGIQFFQLLTPGSLATNLILIPAAMIATLGGFASLLFGLLGFSSGAALCNHAAALLLWLIESVVRLSLEVPGAFIPARFHAGWIGSVALATLLASLLAGYAAGWRRSVGGWWAPFGIVTLVLIFGTQFA